jgi:ketosteroid isomerase-like protein
MRRLVVALALILLGTLEAARATPADDQAAILHMEERHRQALIQADSQALKAMLVSDVRMIWPDGSETDLDSFFKYLGKEVKITSVKQSELTVRVYNGDAAVVTGRWEVEGTLWGRKMEAPRRFAHFWVKQNGQWKLVARHLTVIP